MDGVSHERKSIFYNPDVTVKFSKDDSLDYVSLSNLESISIRENKHNSVFNTFQQENKEYKFSLNIDNAPYRIYDLTSNNGKLYSDWKDEKQTYRLYSESNKEFRYTFESLQRVEDFLENSGFLVADGISNFNIKPININQRNTSYRLNIFSSFFQISQSYDLSDCEIHCYFDPDYPYLLFNQKCKDDKPMEYSFNKNFHGNTIFLDGTNIVYSFSDETLIDKEASYLVIIGPLTVPIEFSTTNQDLYFQIYKTYNPMWPFQPNIKISGKVDWLEIKNIPGTLYAGKQNITVAEYSKLFIDKPTLDYFSVNFPQLSTKEGQSINSAFIQGYSNHFNLNGQLLLESNLTENNHQIVQTILSLVSALIAILVLVKDIQPSKLSKSESQSKKNLQKTQKPKANGP